MFSKALEISVTACKTCVDGSILFCSDTFSSSRPWFQVMMYNLKLSIFCNARIQEDSIILRSCIHSFPLIKNSHRAIRENFNLAIALCRRLPFWIGLFKKVSSSDVNLHCCKFSNQHRLSSPFSCFLVPQFFVTVQPSDRLKF